MLLLLTVVTLLVVMLMHYYSRNLSRYARFTSNIPGPKPWPVIGNVLEFGYVNVELIKNFERLWTEYGNVFKIWVGPYLYIIVSDPKFAEPLLSSNIHITKSFAYKFTEDWLGSGLLTSTGNKWKHHRKIITPTFHFKILEGFIDIFNVNGNILIQKLKEKANKTDFDIHQYVKLFALDNICETAMGVQLNIQDKSTSDYVSAVQGLTDIIMKRIFKPWLFPNFIFKMSELGRRQTAYLKILHGTTNKVIASRKNEILENNNVISDEVKGNAFGQKRRLAFLDLLLQYKMEGAGLTDEEIREEVDTFMFEGHDTISSAIEFCLLLLAKHPECQEEVFEELKEIFGKSDREATMKDIQDMTYLECVIKETLRLYPTVPFFGRILDDDVHLDGINLIKGTNILFSPFFMNRNPDYFPEPEKFDPNRFSPVSAQGRNPYAYIPFGAGPRNCIGQKFAMVELKCTISKIIRNFRLIPSSQEIVLSTELVLRNKGGVILKLEKRD